MLNSRRIWGNENESRCCFYVYGIIALSMTPLVKKTACYKCLWKNCRCVPAAELRESLFAEFMRCRMFLKHWHRCGAWLSRSSMSWSWPWQTRANVDGFGSLSVAASSHAARCMIDEIHSTHNISPCKCLYRDGIACFLLVCMLYDNSIHGLRRLIV